MKKIWQKKRTGYLPEKKTSARIMPQTELSVACQSKYDLENIL
jgi:hypothetical protein